MKGMIFTGFLDFVEEAMGSDMADTIVEDCNFKHGGAYTAVGNYDYREMVALVGSLSRHSKIPAPELIRLFGERLIHRLQDQFSDFFSACEDTLSFLMTVEERIHIEVRKLYPDAELPRFETKRLAPDILVMNYHSCRPFAQLALGMMRGAGKIYGETLDIVEETKTSGEETFVEFTIRRTSNCNGRLDRSTA